LLQANKAKAAIAVFKLNVEAYPNSANVYDSLAEAYLVDGNRIEAITNYEKALEKNPNFQSSIDALRRLKGN
jgi:tetratricopeptide (TPR) repeat protein